MRRKEKKRKEETPKTQLKYNIIKKCNW